MAVLIKRLLALTPTLIVLEATGGMEVRLAAVGLPVAVSTHTRSAALPARWDGWPRPIAWMPRRLPALPFPGLDYIVGRLGLVLRGRLRSSRCLGKRWSGTALAAV